MRDVRRGLLIGDGGLEIAGRLRGDAITARCPRCTRAVRAKGSAAVDADTERRGRESRQVRTAVLQRVSGLKSQRICLYKR